jgi:amino acid transporter
VIAPILLREEEILRESVGWEDIMTGSAIETDRTIEMRGIITIIILTIITIIIIIIRDKEEEGDLGDTMKVRIGEALTAIIVTTIAITLITAITTVNTDRVGDTMTAAAGEIVDIVLEEDRTNHIGQDLPIKIGETTRTTTTTIIIITIIIITTITIEEIAFLEDGHRMHGRVKVPRKRQRQRKSKGVAVAAAVVSRTCVWTFWRHRNAVIEIVQSCIGRWTR